MFFAVDGRSFYYLIVFLLSGLKATSTEAFTPASTQTIKPNYSNVLLCITAYFLLCIFILLS